MLYVDSFISAVTAYGVLYLLLLLMGFYICCYCLWGFISAVTAYGVLYLLLLLTGFYI
jgi:hypothetical protein